VATLALLSAGLLLGACGHKGDPLPPLRIIPAPTRDLRIFQQGDVLLVEMTYPSTTTSGAALGGIDAVELLQLVRPAADGKVPRVEAAEFEVGAKPLLLLRGAELAAATTGDRLEIQLPLSTPLPEPPQALVFGVRTVKAGRASPTSNRAAIVPRTPPTAPSALVLEAQAEGIEVRWSLASDDAEGFRIYRRDARVRGYGEAIATASGKTRHWLDRGVPFGQRYIYTVRALVSKVPPILSAEAGEREIDYQDRFPPPLPARFVALAERNAVRLRWEPSLASDVAGYVLYRREPGREFHRLSEALISGIEYLDHGLASGVTFAYRIQAVDRLGNESARSQPVTAIAR